MMPKIPIIVLTPVKNEAWIIERFLKVTEKFADAIIIADQFSTDETVAIALRCPKVHLIINDNPEYDEAYRQVLLIEKARDLYKGKKCLLALDADEVMTADSLDSAFWNNLHKIEPGTVIGFEKPDVISPIENCIRHESFFYLGYIDDGEPHQGKKIHSVRIPKKDSSPLLNIVDVKFMHYALTRKLEYRARQRQYSVIENIKNVSPFYRRLLSYSPRINDYMAKHNISMTPSCWFNGWEELGIDMRTIPSTEFNTYNLQVLEIFKKYGVEKFYMDDIWDIDWVEFSKKISDDKSFKIKNIPLFNKFILGIIVFSLARYKNIIMRFRSLKDTK
jgi:hypothetical protein